MAWGLQIVYIVCLLLRLSAGFIQCALNITVVISTEIFLLTWLGSLFHFLFACYFQIYSLSVSYLKFFDRVVYIITLYLFINKITLAKRTYWNISRFQILISTIFKSWRMSFNFKIRYKISNLSNLRLTLTVYEIEYEHGYEIWYHR